MEFTQGERYHNADQNNHEDSSMYNHTTSTAFYWPGNREGSSEAAASLAVGIVDNDHYKQSFQQVEKEHMFDKVVTPSDVGKLNRLVIPKQHAEKYFPLDSSANEKDLHLSFEDRNGKPWRFRYSYWNSSQSYVMTKGWSRFVKEKRLDAGDTVSFGRGMGEAKNRLFIDSKRREICPLFRQIPVAGRGVAFSHFVGPLSSRFLPPRVYDDNVLGFQYLYFPKPLGTQFPMQPAELRDVDCGGFPVVLKNSLPVNNNQTAPKRVRLFGVNLDCPESDNGKTNNLDQYSCGKCLQLNELQHSSTESSGASSSSTSKEQQHSSLDLDLF